MLCLAALSLWPAISPLAQEEAQCQNWVALLESREGLVEVKLANSEVWQAVEVGACVPENSQLRVSGGRAVLRLPNESYLRASSDTLIEFSVPSERSWITLVKGWLHFLTRTPSEFDVETPYVNAGVKGTEFTISVDEDAQSSEITVLEGNILADDGTTQVSVSGGNRARFQSDQAPSVFHIDSNQESVQWTLYYPPLLIPDDPLFANARTFLDSNNYALALNTLDEIDDNQRDSDYFSLRSSIYLYTGNITQAEQQIATALAQDGGHPQALALQGIIAVTQHRLDAAQQSIERALTQSESAREQANALLALSYLHQARYQLKEGLSSIDEATRLQPDSALLLSRQAELALMLDDYTLAEQSSGRAVQLQPQLGHARSTRGFVLLQNYDFDAAQASFAEAVQLDSSDPLPHLGLGLIAIRKNNVEYGRRKLELAAVLDPGRSLIRSYLGKAYFTENRDNLASTQYQLAEQMDPNDPTPWLYQAILQQNNHRPFQALTALNKSIALNDNRAIYRSRFNLDTDEASRMANQASIYKDLGLEDRARTAAAASIQLNPGDASGHKLLAQSYADDSLFDEARADETLQAQIFQPLTSTPINPILAVSNLGVIQGTEPGALGFNEYGSLFNREQHHLQVASTRGGNNTRVDAWYLSGLEQHLSYSLGQYFYDTDGYRDNDQLNTEVSSAYLQWQQSERLSLFAQGLWREEQRGDLSQHLLDTMNTEFDVDADDSLGRVGLRYSPTGRIEVMGVYTYRKRHEQKDEFTTQILPSPPLTIILDNQVNTEVDNLSRTRELRLDYRGSDFYTLFGINRRTNVARSALGVLVNRTLIFPPPIPPVGPSAVLNTFEENDSSPDQNSVYSYWYWSPWQGIQFDFGLSYRKMEFPMIDDQDSQLNPKFGLTWRPNNNLDVRFAVFRTLNQGGQIEQSLEPAHVSGFVQEQDALTGTDSKFAGLEITYMPGDNINLGFEAQQRELQPQSFDEPFIETSAELRAGYTANFFSTSVKYNYSRFRRDVIGVQAFPQFPLEVTTSTVPVEIRFFTGKYGNFSTVVNYVDQEGHFESGTGSPISAEDRFEILDVSYELALFNNRFHFELALKNALDKEFAYEDVSYFDTSPRSFRLAPKRTLLGTVTLLF